MAFAPLTIDACNPGPMTGSGNHTYLLVDGGDALLIDAGVGHPDHLSAIARALEQHAARLATIVVTHNHPDHATGVPALAAMYPRAIFAKFPWADDPPAVGFRSEPLGDGEELRFGGEAVTALYTPGHAPDHLVLWHRPTATVFSSDLVIAGSSVMIEASRGGNLSQYLRSLDRILELEPQRLLPAHGPIIDDPRAVVRSYIEHRRRRERQVVAALAAGHRSVETITESIYDGLEQRLMAAARENVLAHLDKLAADGIATHSDGWRLL